MHMLTLLSIAAKWPFARDPQKTEARCQNGHHVRSEKEGRRCSIGSGTDGLFGQQANTPGWYRKYTIYTTRVDGIVKTRNISNRGVMLGRRPRRRPNIWPRSDGLSASKDVWMTVQIYNT